MDINSAFPSNLLKAEDVAQQARIMTIRGCEIQKLGDDTKAVLFFNEDTRGLALNKINANTISDAFGSETNNWIGQQIQLFATTTEFAGKTVPCIRVRGPQAKVPPTSFEAVATAAAPNNGGFPPNNGAPPFEAPAQQPFTATPGHHPDDPGASLDDSGKF